MFTLAVVFTPVKPSQTTAGSRRLRGGIEQAGAEETEDEIDRSLVG
ncbi:MAG: hypothetical protein JJ992_28445 [Planctomycetes bacterium]|nr:hypothetical protein [Planctomycetota bacterium]